MADCSQRETVAKRCEVEKDIPCCHVKECMQVAAIISFYKYKHKQV